MFIEHLLWAEMLVYHPSSQLDPLEASYKIEWVNKYIDWATLVPMHLFDSINTFFYPIYVEQIFSFIILTSE